MFVVFQGGCEHIEVIDTSGIKALGEDVTQVEQLTLLVRERYPNVNSPENKKALSLYLDSQTKVGGHIAEIETRVSASSKVNLPVAEYESSDTSKQLKSSAKELRKVIGLSVVDPSLGREAANFIIAIVGGMLELNGKEKDRVINRFNTQVEKIRMLPFSDLTHSELQKKYATPINSQNASTTNEK